MEVRDRNYSKRVLKVLSKILIKWGGCNPSVILPRLNHHHWFNKFRLHVIMQTVLCYRSHFIYKILHKIPITTDREFMQCFMYKVTDCLPFKPLFAYTLAIKIFYIIVVKKWQFAKYYKAHSRVCCMFGCTHISSTTKIICLIINSVFRKQIMEIIPLHLKK